MVIMSIQENSWEEGSWINKPFDVVLGYLGNFHGYLSPYGSPLSTRSGACTKKAIGFTQVLHMRIHSIMSIALTTFQSYILSLSTGQTINKFSLNRLNWDLNLPLSSYLLAFGWCANNLSHPSWCDVMIFIIHFCI